MKLKSMYFISNPDYEDGEVIPRDSYYGSKLANLLKITNLASDTLIISSIEGASRAIAKVISSAIGRGYVAYGDLWGSNSNPNKTTSKAKCEFSIPKATNIIMKDIYDYTVVVVVMNQRYAKPVLTCVAEHLSRQTHICDGEFEVMHLDASGSTVKVSKETFSKY